MNAPVPAVRHRNSYEAPVEEFLDYPEPMPATQYTPGPRIVRAIGWGLAFSACIWAVVGLVAVSAAIAIGAGLRIIWGI